METDFLCLLGWHTSLIFFLHFCYLKGLFFPCYLHRCFIPFILFLSQCIFSMSSNESRCFSHPNTEMTGKNSTYIDKAPSWVSQQPWCIVFNCCRYDRNKLSLKEITNVQYITCMNPTAGSFTINPRLQVWLELLIHEYFAKINITCLWVLIFSYLIQNLKES